MMPANLSPRPALAAIAKGIVVLVAVLVAAGLLLSMLGAALRAGGVL